MILGQQCQEKKEKFLKCHKNQILDIQFFYIFVHN